MSNNKIVTSGCPFKDNLLATFNTNTNILPVFNGLKERNKNLGHSLAESHILKTFWKMNVHPKVSKKILEKTILYYQFLNVEPNIIIERMLSDLGDYGCWMISSKSLVKDIIGQFNPETKSIILWLESIDRSVPEKIKGQFIVNHLSYQAMYQLKSKVFIPIENTDILKKELVRVFGMKEIIVSMTNLSNLSLLYHHKFTVASFNHLFSRILPYLIEADVDPTTLYIACFSNYPKVRTTLQWYSNKPLKYLYSKAIHLMNAEIDEHGYIQSPMDYLDHLDPVGYLQKYFPTSIRVNSLETGPKCFNCDGIGHLSCQCTNKSFKQRFKSNEYRLKGPYDNRKKKTYTTEKGRVCRTNKK